MIYKYEIIKPVTDKKKPFVSNDGRFFIVPNFHTSYRWYIEVARYNTKIIDYEYFLLLSREKFDEHCRKCRLDDFCRLTVLMHDRFKEYVTNAITIKGNVDFEYVESEDNFDVWQVR